MTLSSVKSTGVTCKTLSGFDFVVVGVEMYVIVSVCGLAIHFKSLTVLRFHN